MNPRQLSISIIGTGNVAWHFAKNFHDRGFVIDAIIGRNFYRAKTLADSVKAEVADNFKHIPQSNVYLLCVKDDAYTSVISALPPSDSLYLHTSGGLEMDILQRLSPNYGVLYPYQTLTKRKELDFSTVPLCLEASNFFSKKILSFLAERLSLSTHWLTSQQRQYLHLAGVFASNFPNALFVVVKQILNSRNIDFSIAIPLIKETVEKLDMLYPEEAQTGPAARGDNQVTDKHLKLIDDPRYREIYKLMSEIIQIQQKIK
ncbi:MAG: DUF2520 domain-containing protein [Bacteroidales bacterium]|jgi:predicted short-subunit dehydrogenase-like oxidoreductase (DUF2520 family)|nr:DUF2520 domain-containing protein [Bacteroidales bacterium]